MAYHIYHTTFKKHFSSQVATSFQKRRQRGRGVPIFYFFF